MQEMFQMLEEQMNAGKDCMLIKVIKKSGSVPCADGACMIVGKNGRLWGTIGGGNLEYQACIRAVKLIDEKRSERKEYCLGGAEAAELGMVCGGTVSVLFYYMDSSDQAQAAFSAAGSRVCKEHLPYWLLLPLEEGQAVISEHVREARSKMLTRWNGHLYYAEQFACEGKVYVFGSGHLAQETVPVLSHLGFRCVVADDRDDFTKPEMFAGAEKVLKTDFLKLPGQFDIHAEDYIVVMTRGHRYDMYVEEFALRTPAHYVGVVGSRHKTQYVRQKLMEKGFSEKALNRIVTPIGMDIHAQTPAEIAVSIAAQLILVRSDAGCSRRVEEIA